MVVIIKTFDVKRIGKELIKKVYDFLHDYDYILKEFPEFLETQKKFKNDLVYIRFRELNCTITSTNKSIKYEYSKLDESKFEEELKSSVEEIKNGTMDIHIIYEILKDTIPSLDFELDEDLYDKIKAFLDIYNVYKYHYHYLED